MSWTRCARVCTTAHVERSGARRRIRTLHEVKHGAALGQRSSTAQLTTKAQATSSAFTFRDIEESLSTFGGEDAYTVTKWIEDTERTARMLKWNDLQQLMYGKRLLKGVAKRFMRSIDVDSWEELKDGLRDQFNVELSDADIHKKLGERKKSSKETLQDYLIAMNEIGKVNNVKEDSIMQYVIDSIDDDPRNKAMLFGATTMREFRLKLIAYEKFRSGFAKKKDVKGEAKGESKQSNERAGPSARKDRRCYGCGEEGHISAKCPDKSKGEKCFACNEFGHRATACPNKEKKVATCTKR